MATSAVPMRAKTSFTSGICLSRVLERMLHLERLRQAGAGNPDRRDRDVAFVEARDEFAAHARRGEPLHDDDDSAATPATPSR